MQVHLSDIDDFLACFIMLYLSNLCYTRNRKTSRVYIYKLIVVRAGNIITSVDKLNRTRCKSHIYILSLCARGLFYSGEVATRDDLAHM